MVYATVYWLAEKVLNADPDTLGSAHKSTCQTQSLMTAIAREGEQLSGLENNYLARSAQARMALAQDAGH